MLFLSLCASLFSVLLRLAPPTNVCEVISNCSWEKTYECERTWGEKFSLANTSMTELNDTGKKERKEETIKI